MADDVHKVQLVNRMLSDPAALVATFIAVCALFTSIWQGIEIRKHSRIATRPILDIDYELSSSGAWYGLNIANEGTGPARIQSVRLMVDDTPVANASRNGWPEALDQLEINERFVAYRTLYPDELLSIGANKPYFGIYPGNLEAARCDRLKAAVKHLRIQICYCSLYDDCESYETAYHQRPIRRFVEKCPPIDNEPVLTASVGTG